MATSNPYSDSLLMDALRGSLSNAESFGRGFAVAPVGLLGDIEGLLRKGVNFSFGRGGVNVGETPVLPTTEGLLSSIPRMTPRRMETAGMEQIGSAANPRGPINLGRAVASLPSDVARAGKEFLAAGQPARVVPQVRQRSPYPQEQALRTAQENAALPVEQGGLGLLADNTPEMRAKAMGFDLNENLYHGTEGDFSAFQKSPKFNTYATEDPEIADIYAMSERRSNNAGPNIIPLVARGKKLKVSDYDEANPENFSGGWFGNNIALRLGIPWQRNLTKRLPAYGYDRLEVNDMADLGGIQTQHMFPEPEVLRSRFAAFDPFRKDVATATAMGVALPDLLAAEYNQQPQSAGLLYPLP